MVLHYSRVTCARKNVPTFILLNISIVLVALDSTCLYFPLERLCGLKRVVMAESFIDFPVVDHPMCTQGEDITLDDSTSPSFCGKTCQEV